MFDFCKGALGRFFSSNPRRFSFRKIIWNFRCEFSREFLNGEKMFHLVTNFACVEVCVARRDTNTPAELILGNLSTRVFETQTATGRENFACQASGVSQMFTLIISNRETICSSVNVAV